MFSLTSLGGFGSFTGLPTNIPGLVSWYDAQNLASITKDGSNNVSQWNDLSGLGLNMAQGTLANQPLYVTSGVSSLPSLQFNGTSQFLSGTTSTAYTDFTVFAAVNAATTATNRGIVGRRSTSTSVPVVYQMQILAAATVSGTVRDNSNNIAVSTTSTSGTGDVIASTARSTNTVTAWRNNTGAVPTTPTPSNFGAVTATATSIGALFSGSTTPIVFYNSYIGEILLYNRNLSADERAAVYLYLKNKWGL